MSKNKQLIVIDDGSPLRKQTQALIKRFSSKLKRKAGAFLYIENRKSLGFAGSYNVGMQLAEGEIVVIINDDIYLPVNSIDSMVKTLMSDSQIGVVGPVTNSAWSFQNTTLFGKIKDFSKKETEKIERFAQWLKKTMSGKTYSMKSAFSLNGFCLVFPKKVLEKVNYFDPRYKYGLYEDVDLTLKILKQGKNVVLDAATFVEHGGPKGSSVSLKQHRLRKLKALIVNTIKFANKWNNYLSLPRQLMQISMQEKGFGTITKEIVKTAQKRDYGENI